LRSALHALPGAAAAALYAAAFGMIAGVLGCAFAGSLGFGVRAAIVAFLLAVAVLAYGRWRAQRLRRAAFLDRWYHEDLSAPSLDEALTYIRFADKRRIYAKGRR
jgi:hypothetical protein